MTDKLLLEQQIEILKHNIRVVRAELRWHELDREKASVLISVLEDNLYESQLELDALEAYPVTG